MRAANVPFAGTHGKAFAIGQGKVQYAFAHLGQGFQHYILVEAAFFNKGKRIRHGASMVLVYVW
jgi:hypothetical protein